MLFRSSRLSFKGLISKAPALGSLEPRDLSSFWVAPRTSNVKGNFITDLQVVTGPFKELVPQHTISSSISKIRNSEIWHFQELVSELGP